MCFVFRRLKLRPLKKKKKRGSVRGDMKQRSHPSRGEEVTMGCSCLSSLSLSLDSWPLTGAADVRAASGTRLSLFVFSCQFSALPCSWLMSKLLQLFVGVTFAEADWLTLLVVWVVSVCGTGSREGWKDHLNTTVTALMRRTLLTASISGRDHTSHFLCNKDKKHYLSLLQSCFDCCFTL